MVCSRCGGELPDEARFCAFCGAPTEAGPGEGIPPPPVGVPPPPAIEQAPGEARTSGLAIASFVLGVLTLAVGITAPLGIILGIVALFQIRASRGRLTGAGWAIAGICISAALIVVGLILMLSWYLIYGKAA